ncbi:MAG: hypothetical protein IJX78_05605 [Bacilli bacterium]|nr:hypothetical protein [Bacilli bacterium]
MIKLTEKELYDVIIKIKNTHDESLIKILKYNFGEYILNVSKKYAYVDNDIDELIEVGFTYLLDIIDNYKFDSYNGFITLFKTRLKNGIVNEVIGVKK